MLEISLIPIPFILKQTFIFDLVLRRFFLLSFTYFLIKKTNLPFAGLQSKIRPCRVVQNWLGLRIKFLFRLFSITRLILINPPYSPNSSVFQNGQAYVNNETFHAVFGHKCKILNFFIYPIGNVSVCGDAILD